MIIPARFTSDDGVVSVDFDAQEWFSTIEAKEINELYACDFSADYVCDNAAYFMAEKNPELEKAIKYVQEKYAEDGETGFLVAIAKAQSERFIQNHKSHFCKEL